MPRRAAAGLGEQGSAFALKEALEGRRMGFFVEENGQPRIKELVAQTISLKATG
jgi:hypothetical protein